jgi:hypothetical protein
MPATAGENMPARVAAYTFTGACGGLSVVRALGAPVADGGGVSRGVAVVAIGDEVATEPAGLGLGVPALGGAAVQAARATATAKEASRRRRIVRQSIGVRSECFLVMPRPGRRTGVG